jgi:hypothetical protein
MQRLDLLHCDVQGAELDVLRSCRDLFAAGRIGWVFVSTHHHLISGDPLTHQRCLRLLEAAGAIIVAEHTVQESFSGDGLIVARFGALPADWPDIALSRARVSQTQFRNPLYDLAAARAAVAEARRQLEDQRARAEAVEAVRAEAEAARAEAEAARDTALREITALRASTSWRTTAPLRGLASLFRRAAGGEGGA